MPFVEFEPGTKHFKAGGEESDTPDAFTDCGYVIGKDEVIIDVDSIPKDKIQKMLVLFNLNTEVVWTDRGAHIYFRRPVGFSRGKNAACALGFPIETKTHTNTPQGITIKRNGVERVRENPGQRMLLPWYFSSQKQYTNLVGLGQDEGRNNALFAHKGKLDGNQDTERIIRFINDVLFDTPLPESEISTILRDYQGGKSSGGSEYDIATELMNVYKCVIYQGAIWWWNGEEYVADFEDDDRMRKLIYNRCQGCKSRLVDEVIKQIHQRGTKKDIEAFPMRFLNGFLQDDEFVEFRDFSEFTPYFIRIDYHPDAPPVREVDDYIDQLTDADPCYRKLLMEILGYVMMTDPDRIRSVGKFFIFRGNGANGKGTLLQIMRRIYGVQNCSALSIKQIEDPKYQVNMLGKLANLGDDVQADAINNDQMKTLKNITTADTVETRRLYHQSETVTFTTKLYFTANDNIKSYEKGYGYQRRVMWVPMFNTITKPDPHFIAKMTTPAALDYWMRLIVEGYKRLWQNRAFTECERVAEYNREYHIENNHMYQFLEDIDIETEVLGKTPREVKDLYDSINDDPTRKYSTKLLTDLLKKQGIGLGRKKVDKVVRRVFMRQADTSQALFGVTQQ